MPCRDFGRRLPVVQRESHCHHFLIRNITNDERSRETVGSTNSRPRRVHNAFQQSMSVGRRILHRHRRRLINVNFTLGRCRRRPRGHGNGRRCPENGRGSRELAVGLSLRVIASGPSEQTGRPCAAAERANSGKLIGGKADIFGNGLGMRRRGSGACPELKRRKGNVRGRRRRLE